MLSLKGLVMSPKKYTLYTKPLGDIIRNHGLGFHVDSDDTPLYVILKADEENLKYLRLLVESRRVC